MFAEGVAGLLAKAERVEAAESDPKRPDIDLIRAKAEVARSIPLYRAALYPVDEP